MAAESVLENSYYIVDYSGNYYRVSANNQLMVATKREEAGVFDYAEANQRIGSGRKAQFYSLISIDESEQSVSTIASEIPATASEKITAFPVEAMKVQDTSECGDAGIPEAYRQARMELPYDLRKMDWVEYLTHFAYIVSNLRNYQDELNQCVSDADMQICDLMHYIELYDLQEESLRPVMDKLKACREYRRDAKDEMLRIEWFQKTIGNSTNVAKAKEAIKQIEKLKNRKYHPRKLGELFRGTPQLTSRPNRLWEESDEDIFEEAQSQMTEEAGMELWERKETIFDGRQNDWGQFAKMQAEFYAQAPQYIYNLETDIQEIDAQIDEILYCIEDANYNVAQGYKVFKELKDLRNERKQKEKELETLRILTEGFDCAAMEETCLYNLREIEKMCI